MAAVKAPIVGGKGDVTLDEIVFGAEIKPHLVHEAVRAELNDARQATRGAKSRGLVSGGRSKPWRQKGTGRARQGTTRAPQWKGGGVAFPPNDRNFEVKINKKAQRAALRSALSDHAQAGTIGVLDPSSFDAPSTKGAVALLASAADATRREALGVQTVQDVGTVFESRRERAEGDHAPHAFLDLAPDGNGVGWIDVEHALARAVLVT